MADGKEESGEMEPTTFGGLLKRYRMKASLTQEALAERANLSTRAISDLERGLSRMPRYDTLEMLTSALGLSAEQRAALFATARPPLPEEGAKATSLQGLPFPPTALLGRDQEVTQALDLLRAPDVRLLTLTGPSGVGKTRLALELAHTECSRFADGLAWIDLTMLRDPSLVPLTVAQALGLREQTGQAFPERVRVFLQGKQFLLLLDNFEHLLSAADFVATLLIHCPGLHVLVTSRTPLHLRAEQQLMLTPLTQASSVALFRERAQRVQPGLELTEPLVAAICDQVDRLPLAIELVAVHVKALALPVLLARLTNRLRLLGGGARDLPERQQTMREAIAWSYNLLSPTQRRWFRTLGIFTGGCTLAAVEAVCWGEESSDSGEALSAITELVDASLVQMEPMGEEGMPRYRLLEVIHEYALEQLRVMGEEDLYRERHAEYYAALAEEVGRIEPGQGSREAHLLLETANGRSALDWAYEQGEVALGLRLATCFGRFWMKRGQMSEGSMWMERLLTLDGATGAQVAPPAVRGRAYNIAALLAMDLGRNERAAALAREALAFARQTGDQVEITLVFATLGNIALASGKEDEASAYYTESYAAAKCAGEAAILGFAFLNLGELARKRGEFARATTFLEEALATARAFDMTWEIANVLTLLGHLARQQQDYERAKWRYRESLPIYQQLVNATYIAWCLEGIASMACSEGCYQHAARLCAAAAVLRVAAHTPLPPTEQDDFDKVLLTARAQLDERIFAEEWRIGTTMPQDEAIAYALMGPLA